MNVWDSHQCRHLLISILRLVHATCSSIAYDFILTSITKRCQQGVLATDRWWMDDRCQLDQCRTKVSGESNKSILLELRQVQTLR